MGCDEESSTCGAPAWCTEGREGCRAPGDCDGDGSLAMECVGVGGDCGDSDEHRYPGLLEVCDDRDQDCDPSTLAGPDDGDLDGDGFVSGICCNGTTCGSDCDDTRADIFPGAAEVCNNLDDDCDGAVDGVAAFCPFGTCIDGRCRASTWARTFGGGSGVEGVSSLVTDRDGNLYALVFSSSADGFDLGSDRIRPGMTLISYSPSGLFRWSRHLGNFDLSDPLESAFTSMSTVSVGPSGEVIAVRVTAEGTDLVRLSAADGSEIATTPHMPPIPWTSSFLFQSAATAEGIVLFGAVTDASTFRYYLELRGWDGALVTGRVLTELDGSGAPSGTRHQLAAAAGRVVFTSYVAAAATLDGVSIEPGIALISTNTSFAATSSISLSPEVFAHDVALSTSGEVIVVGRHVATVGTPWGETWTHTSGEPGFAFALGSDGAHRWTRRDTNASYGFAAMDGRGGVGVGGAFTGTLNLGLGAWAASGTCEAYSATLALADGVALEGRSFTGTGCEEVQGVAIDPFGGIYVAGSFTHQITLGGSTFASSFSGRADVFLVRVAD